MTKRYLTFVFLLGFMFVNFVACGAQMYQVSLKDDTQQVSNVDSYNPSSPQFGLHSPDGWKNLPIHFKVDQAMNPDQKIGLQRAMLAWEMAVGKKLFVFDGVDSGKSGDSFKDLYSSLDDQVNGHYLDDNWDKTQKGPEVLATTIWDNDPDDDLRILTSDIRFNSNYYVIGNAFTSEAEGKREVVDMQSLALHELGHLLGLTHMKPVDDSYSVMNPTVYIGEGMSNRKLSRGDIERIQKVYGCENSACDIDTTLEQINSMNQGDKDTETRTADASR